MEKSLHFTSLDYYSRREAKVTIAHYLMEQADWKVFGYHADTSDAMSDYYNPASWGGIATYKNEYVLVIDVSSAAYSGKAIEKSEQKFVPCTHCKESGAEPNGFTYAKACEMPDLFWNERKEADQGVLLIHSSSNRVPRDFFNDEGLEKCSKCRGKGQQYDHTETTVIDHFPVYKPNPGRKGWHFEKLVGGPIITSGQTIARMYRGYWYGTHEQIKAHIQAECAKFVAELINSISPSKAPHSAGAAVSTGEFTIIDYSEKAIALRGDTKPIKDKLSSLRGRFNAHLKDPKTGEKFMGWIFSKKQRTEVENLIATL